MAAMDSEQIIGSCNAAGLHFLQVWADYSGGDSTETWRDSILSRNSRPNRHGGDGQ
jgi:hypothetical protein